MARWSGVGSYLRSKLKCWNKRTESERNKGKLWMGDVCMLVTVCPQKKGVMKQVIYSVLLGAFCNWASPLRCYCLNLDWYLSITRREKKWHHHGAWTRVYLKFTFYSKQFSQGSVIKEQKTWQLLTYSVLSLAVFRQAQWYLRSISALGSCSGNDCWNFLCVIRLSGRLLVSSDIVRSGKS